jgi:hypothetical protein
MHVTQLARGAINHADAILIELVESSELPPVIRLNWPQKPTITAPAQLDAVVATAMRILASSVVELAALRGESDCKREAPPAVSIPRGWRVQEAQAPALRSVIIANLSRPGRPRRQVLEEKGCGDEKGNPLAGWCSISCYGRDYLCQRGSHRRQRGSF